MLPLVFPRSVVVASDPATLTVHEAAELLRARQLSPRELTAAVLRRIDRLEGRVNAFITVTAEAAGEAARTAEEEIAAGRYRGPLHGIPIGLKDLYWTAGVRTTAGSKILGDFVPEEDAGVVTRLREAGAISVGKLNLHEFAYGVTTANEHYGTTRNPWNPEFVTGGSSGGSGAAVAAHLCLAATGSDTGGSIRIPASICGVVGLKPNYGRVSLHGVIPLAPSLDHAGPLTKDVRDAALLLNAMAGYDPRDPYSVDLPAEDFTAGLNDGVRGLRVGVPTVHFFDETDPEIARLVREAIAVLEGLGMEVREVLVPSSEELRGAYLAIITGEAAAYHEQWLATQPQAYGSLVRRRLEATLSTSAAAYVRAMQRRRQVTATLERLLTEEVDVLASPATRVPPPTVAAAEAGEDSLPTLVLNSSPFDATGEPAISVPCGFLANGLPVGLQLASRRWSESLLLRVAYAYEQASEWHRRQPPLAVAL